MTKPFEITDETFEAEVLQATELTLVDFWGSGCSPCRMVAPIVEEIASDYEDTLRVGKMNVDNNRETPGKYGITGIPTLILFKDGAEATRIIGFRPKDSMVEELLPYLE
jgi:thioredoxin 1